MVFFGDMVVGVVYEVNILIGLGVIVFIMMFDRIVVIEKDFENKILKVSVMKCFLEESNENFNIIYCNLNCVVELIFSFK